MNSKYIKIWVPYKILNVTILRIRFLSIIRTTAAFAFTLVTQVRQIYTQIGVFYFCYATKNDRFSSYIQNWMTLFVYLFDTEHRYHSLRHTHPSLDTVLLWFCVLEVEFWCGTCSLTPMITVKNVQLVRVETGGIIHSKIVVQFSD